MTPRQRAGLTIGAVIFGHAAVLAALFWRVWWRDEISSWDCVVEYWPDLIFQVHAIADGEWPSWNPYALGGYPVWADPQAGLYAPASWVAWLGAALGGDGPWLIQLKVLLNLLVGLTGMHAWTWVRTRSHAAAAVAAWTLVIGSPLLVHKNGALLWPILYLPWALLALERFCARPSLRRGAVLAAGLWGVGSAGHPQSFFYGGVVLLLYWVFLTVAAAPRAPHRTLARQAPGGAVALGLGALLLAATWIPAWRAVERSPRAERGDLYVLEEAMEPEQLDELIAPNLDDDWQADVYVGPLAILGGLWLVIAAPRRRARAEAGFWLGVGALGLLLALGRDGHLLPWFADHVPGFDLFRIAYRHKLIFGVAAAVLAGDAVAHALRPGGPRAAWSWIGLAAGWLGLAIVAEVPADAWLAGFAIVIALAAAIAADETPAPWPGWLRRAAVVVVPALVLADLWDAGASKLWILQPRPDPAELVANVPALEGTDGPWRYHVGDAAPPYGGTVPYQAAFLAERREWSGYLNPIEPRRHAELEARAREWPEVLRHFNVRYFAGHPWPIPGSRPVAPGIVAADDVVPIARWYGTVEVLDAHEILARLTAIPPSRTRVAYVEAGDAPSVRMPRSPGAPTDGRLIRYRRDEVIVDYDAPAVGVLVLAEAYAPGWVAEVDGKRAVVFRANYHNRAIVVPPGTHRVVFRYRPRGRTALPVLFLVGLVGLGALAFVPWKRLDEVRA